MSEKQPDNLKTREKKTILRKSMYYDDHYSVPITNKNMYQKSYAISKIYFYKDSIDDMEIVLSSRYGYLQNKYGGSIKSIILPIDNLPLTNLDNPKGNNGAFAVRAASGKPSYIDVYIPMDMLGIKMTKKIVKNSIDVYEVYEGFYGIYFEEKTSAIQNSLDEIEKEYRKLYRKLGGANMFASNFETFSANMNKLVSLAKDYFVELERVECIVDERLN